MELGTIFCTLHDGRKHQNSEKAWGDDDEWQMLGANKLTDRVRCAKRGGAAAARGKDTE